MSRYDLIKSDIVSGNLKGFLTGEPPYGKNQKGYEDYAYYYDGLGVVIQCLSVLIEDGHVANSEINRQLINMASDSNLGLLALQYIEYYFDYYLKLECFSPFCWKPDVKAIINRYNSSCILYTDKNKLVFSKGIAERLKENNIRLNV